MISQLLYHLPGTKRYNVLFIKRNLEEVITSQNAMLERRVKPKSPVRYTKLIEIFQKHLIDIEKWLKEHKQMDVLDINYPDVLKQPMEMSYKIQQLLSTACLVDVEKMAAVVDRNLYRQRR